MSYDNALYKSILSLHNNHYNMGIYRPGHSGTFQSIAYYSIFEVILDFLLYDSAPNGSSRRFVGEVGYVGMSKQVLDR